MAEAVSDCLECVESSKERRDVIDAYQRTGGKRRKKARLTTQQVPRSLRDFAVMAWFTLLHRYQVTIALIGGSRAQAVPLSDHNIRELSVRSRRL